MASFWDEVLLNKYICFNRNFWMICPQFIRRKQLDISRIQLEALWEWFELPEAGKPWIKEQSTRFGIYFRCLFRNMKGRDLRRAHVKALSLLPLCHCALLLFVLCKNGRRDERIPPRILSENTIAHYHWPMPNLSHSSNWTLLANSLHLKYWTGQSMILNIPWPVWVTLLLPSFSCTASLAEPET